MYKNKENCDTFNKLVNNKNNNNNNIENNLTVQRMLDWLEGFAIQFQSMPSSLRASCTFQSVLRTFQRMHEQKKKS